MQGLDLPGEQLDCLMDFVLIHANDPARVILYNGTNELSEHDLVVLGEADLACVGAVPPTAVPPTAVPPTAVPPTAVPPTAVPPTAVPPTAVPPTAVPLQRDAGGRLVVPKLEGLDPATGRLWVERIEETWFTENSESGKRYGGLNRRGHRCTDADEFRIDLQWPPAGTPLPTWAEIRSVPGRTGLFYGVEVTEAWNQHVQRSLFPAYAGAQVFNINLVSSGPCPIVPNLVGLPNGILKDDPYPTDSAVEQFEQDILAQGLRGPFGYGYGIGIMNPSSCRDPFDLVTAQLPEAGSLSGFVTIDCTS